MTPLYRPVLIESAEQAEALPEGAIFWTQRPHGYRYDYGTVGKGGVILASDGADEPDTLHALVPIEAEEETRLFPARYRGERKLNDTHRKARLVTPWEAV